LNCAASKVGKVVTAVLTLVNKEQDSKPSTSTVLVMNLRERCIAHKQIADVYPKEDITSLLSDETSKLYIRLYS